MSFLFLLLLSFFDLLIDQLINVIGYAGNNIAAARLAGLEDDLNLSSVQYQVCVYISFNCTGLLEQTAKFRIVDIS